MATRKKSGKRSMIGFRPQPEDDKIIQAGIEKLEGERPGSKVDQSDVIRMALRKFAEAYKLELAR